MATDFKQQYDKYLSVFNDFLQDAYESLDFNAPKTITQAMNYAVQGGGKRIRPVLCLATADALSVPFEKVKEFCVAIESIHSYSLVHDDLPAMDNDDFRRGKLSTHKKFGEANGILAGDALLNFAFEYCLSKNDFTIEDAKALKIIAEFAGYRGMIAGQVLDLQNENNDCADEKVLYEICFNKTAKLIMAPILVACALSGNKYYKNLYDYGYNLGILFQIIDDVMDVEGTLESIGKTPNKDKDSNKLTSVRVFGLEGAKNRAKFHYEQCKGALIGVKNSEFLALFADAMFVRRK